MSVSNVDPVTTPRTFEDAMALDASLAQASAEQILAAAVGRFGDRLVIASSFGAEDVVLVDMAARLNVPVRIFTLDTGRLPQETYDVMDRLRERYNLTFEVLLPDAEALRQLLTQKGANSFYRSVADRRECCQIRKVEPLQRVLATADAWVTGLRREQAVTRFGLPVVEFDLLNDGKYKFNPLANWTEAQVWERIRERDIPYNLLHDRGYPSIGCAPCTRAIAAGEDLRAGRWWWEQPEEKECGLHKRD
jgi:phosphoadenosine phosphosulfate reductase